MTFKATAGQGTACILVFVHVFAPRPPTIIDFLLLSCFLQFLLWLSRPCWDAPHPCRVTLSRRQRTIVFIWCSGFVRAQANHFTGECRTHTQTRTQNVFNSIACGYLTHSHKRAANFRICLSYRVLRLGSHLKCWCHL